MPKSALIISAAKVPFSGRKLKLKAVNSGIMPASSNS